MNHGSAFVMRSERSMNVAVPPPTCTTAPSGVAAGITSARRVRTSSVVA